MIKPKLTRLMTAISLGMLSSYAGAAGFQLLNQNVSGLGNAYAGSAAVADNASTIFYNPAGMTQLKEREFSAGVAAISPSIKFTNNGSSVGTLGTAGNGGDAGHMAAVPNAYLSWALNKNMYVGVGFSAPFGSKSEYSNPWLGSAQSNSFLVETININPSIAYRVSDDLSVGAGLNWQQLKGEYKRTASIFIPTGSVTAKFAGDTWGWNVGGLLKVSPVTKVGVSYRSAMSYDTKGDIVTTGIPIPGADAANTSDAKASIKLPDVFILSGTHQLSNQWEVLGDLAWTGWSSIPKLDLIRTSGVQNGVTAQTLETDFRDVWRLSIGANYQYAQDIKLKFGLAFDQSPVKGEKTRLVSLPDNDRTLLTTGVQWTLANGSSLDVGIGYVKVADSTINNDQTNANPARNRGLVKGSYDSSSWTLGVQYSMPF